MQWKNWQSAETSRQATEVEGSTGKEESNSNLPFDFSKTFKRSDSFRGVRKKITQPIRDAEHCQLDNCSQCSLIYMADGSRIQNHLHWEGKAFAMAGKKTCQCEAHVLQAAFSCLI